MTWSVNVRKIEDLEELRDLLKAENPNWAPGFEEVVLDMVREGEAEAWLDADGKTALCTTEEEAPYVL